MIRRKRVALTFYLNLQRVAAIVGRLALATAAVLTPGVTVAAAPGEHGAAKAAKTVRYNRDIRPILADKCFKCHGPDANERKAKLRLDRAVDAQKPAASGNCAIVPGKLDDSALYERVTSNDPEERMPPAKTGKSLTPAEIAKLKSWIEEGAEYEGHWAFTPPVRPALPAVKQASWCRNPIDYFIMARLEAEGLAPSPEAERLTLLRRLKLDLAGLPPSIEEADAFSADAGPGAYTRQVDRLLGSPQYGERWGRIWLDAARYADSDGYEKDKPRFVHFYRTWVIKSLNRDLPYNQFIIEQIAGDLLPAATQDQIAATGYLRNSMINEEGGVDPEQFRMEAMFDRMDCIGKGVLGLTIQCAQCHSHKYDPLTQEEYYRMFAFLNNAHEANVPVYTAGERDTIAGIVRQISEIEQRLKSNHTDWREQMADWENQVSEAKPQPQWVIINPEVDADSTGGCKYLPMGDGSLLAQSYAPTKHTLQLSMQIDLSPITGFRLELMTDPNLPLNGPGRSIKGTAALTEFRVETQSLKAGAKSVNVKIAKASSDINLPEAPLDKIHDDKSGRKRVTGPVAFAIDNKDETAWGIDNGPGRRNRPRQAVFVPEKPIAFMGEAIITINLVMNHGGWNSDDNQNCNLGRFRLAITSDPDPLADPIPPDVRAILVIPREKRTRAQTDAVFAYWRTTVPGWKGANAQIEALWRQHPEGTSQLVLEERERRRATHVLERGDFLKPTREVEPGVPAFLNSLVSGEPPNRLSFARWLVARDAPTTARSIVNRVWQAYFGTGIVATSEDLGMQCEPPSHADLLDWLAVELVESGWSLKHLHRLITTSAVYRQQSRMTPELLARDPYNRLLARGPRFRVDAEIVRDIALAASGLLYTKIGGPSASPPAPAFLFLPPASYGPKVWTEATGPDRCRRALYTFRYRSIPYPMLQAFDAPNGDFACVRRPRSNTPLQALTTLNEPIYLECARALALCTVYSGGSTDKDRLTYAVRRVLGRAPEEHETTILLDLLKRETCRFGEPGAKPWDLAANDPARPPQLPPGMTPDKLAGWTAVARVLLNLDETMTKQ
jgi:hypothetical protein